MKRLISWLAALALAVGLGLIVPSSATAAPYCGITWGSTAEARPGSTTAPIVNVRSGRQACFDRLVIDVNGKIAGYDVRYVDAVHQPGSGFAVPLRGAADLQVTVQAPAYDAWGNPTYHPADRNELVNVSGYPTFRQVALAGSFEGQSVLGLGVRARLPFRAFVLDGPGHASRLVIDVAHQW